MLIWYTLNNRVNINCVPIDEQCVPNYYVCIPTTYKDGIDEDTKINQIP